MPTERDTCPRLDRLGCDTFFFTLDVATGLVQVANDERRMRAGSMRFSLARERDAPAATLTLRITNTSDPHNDTMIRHDYSRVEPKRRANLDYKKRQFAKADFQQQHYEHRLNFYGLPPTAEITLDEF